MIYISMLHLEGECFLARVCGYFGHCNIFQYLYNKMCEVATVDERKPPLFFPCKPYNNRDQISLIDMENLERTYLFNRVSKSTSKPSTDKTTKSARSKIVADSSTSHGNFKLQPPQCKSQQNFPIWFPSNKVINN
jgi:hypothetical protein